MKSQNHFFLFLLLSSVLILSILVIFLKFHIFAQIRNSNPTTQNSKSSKTYTNSILGYSFQYPIGWSIKESPPPGKRIQSIILYNIGSTDIIFRVENKQTTCFATDIKCYLPSEMEAITIDSRPAFQIDSYIPEPGGVNPTQKVRIVMIESNGKVYSFSQQHGTNNANTPTTFDQILSTFRFTDPSETSVKEDKFLDSKAPYNCPASDWIDCMPGPDKTNKQCSPDALNWFRENCPNFQGAAL